MSLLKRVRQGLVGAALLATERGVAEVSETRARHRPTGPNEDVEVSVATVREDFEVGLPRGETALDELRQDADMKRLFGVSMQDMRYLAGIENPYGECRFNPEEVDFESVEFFREVRNAPASKLTAKTRQAIVEAAERAGVDPPNTEFRAFGRNPRRR
jgi:AraC-like DNA-binding protein